jgi:hypothetical protein
MPCRRTDRNIQAYSRFNILYFAYVPNSLHISVSYSTEWLNVDRIYRKAKGMNQDREIKKNTIFIASINEAFG